LQMAIVCILNLTIGMVTPPVGSLLFVTSSVSGVKMGPLVREAMPMFGALMVVLALLTFFPSLTTWLPNLMGYTH
jgi:TRAP-type C4-dicarboxylate transport system permease large subunit